MAGEVFRIWARIEPVASGEYDVVAKAVPESADPAGILTLTEVHVTCEGARVAVRALVARLASALHASGGVVGETQITDGCTTA